MKYSAKEVEKILKDYSWMLNTVKATQESLEKTEGAPISQYGIDAALPAGKGVTNDVVYGEVLRREKQWERIEAYEERVRFVQQNLQKITDDREAEVLYWLLEGKSNRWIANHMMLSHTHIKRMVRSIAEKMM